jgi:hypothetical protein
VSALAAAWGRLSREQHQAALAAVGLVVALFLPWYEKSIFQATGRGQLISAASNLSAFQVISWVEAAVMLVAVGVLFLLWARSQEKGFHLPGGDGTVIFAAGCWAALLLVWRLFDKPDVAGAGATVGIQWGWFVALVMAGLLAAAGFRVRAAHRPEPPLPAEDEGWEPAPRDQPRPGGDGADARRARRRGRAGGAAAGTGGEVLREPPAWEGEPPAAPDRIRPSAPPVADPSEAPTELGPPGDPAEAPTRRETSGDPSEAPTRRPIDLGPASDDPSEAPTERGPAGDPSEAPTRRGTAARRRAGDEPDPSRSEDRLF